ncbi:hypothetical protein IKD82_02300 [Candidatus Saccharibacteria bacterium]|nr:hypothetical protein [Candidatus Saccharibacteria bacterium]
MAQALKDVSWEAEEYIVRDRDGWWYVGLAVVGIALCVLSIVLKWWTFLILVILSIIMILISTFRPPRKIQYLLNKEGLTEGGRLHKYEDYKAFGILKEDSHFSAILIPKKRFGLSVKVYFPGDNGEAIVDMLGSRLPMEEIKLDFLDKIVNFLRI